MIKKILKKVMCPEQKDEFYQREAENGDSGFILYDMTIVADWMKADYMTGIGRVSIQLFKELSELATVIPVRVEGKRNTIILRVLSPVDYSDTNKIIEPKEGDIFFMPELQIRGVQIKRNHPYVGILREKGVKNFAVIHDILPLRMPQYFERATGRNFAGYVREIADNYDGILAVSECVGKDIAEYYTENQIHPSPSIKIGFFHNGYDGVKELSQNPSDEIQHFFDTEKNVYLMVGTIEPRKGHEIIFDVFQNLWSRGFEGKLCIIGRPGWNTEKFVNRLHQYSDYGKNVRHFNQASDADVKYAYQNADCLIQASAGEGFGLPLVEAGNYKIPILCSDIPVFHEVAGDAVTYFDRKDSKSIEDCILNFENEEEHKDSSDVQKSSWKNSAKKIYNMMIKDEGWIAEI